MTTPYDTLGRPPVMRRRPEPEIDIDAVIAADDWRGEALVRNVRRRSKAASHVPKAPARTCSVPECAVPLRSDNGSRVCYHHTHRKGHCRCAMCQRRDA